MDIFNGSVQVLPVSKYAETIEFFFHKQEDGRFQLTINNNEYGEDHVYIEFDEEQTALIIDAARKAQ